LTTTVSSGGDEGQGPFANTLLEAVIFADGTKEIPAYVLLGAENVINVNIPQTAGRLGYRAFEGMSSLKSLYIPSSVITFGNRVFENHASDFVIYGEAGSAAEKYAKENNIEFRAATKPKLDPPTANPTPGVIPPITQITFILPISGAKIY
jgi:hypothetical protein